MKERSQEIYDNLKNAELVEILADCMEAVQQRSFLRDCLTEQTYDPSEDAYDYEYSDSCFESFIRDLRKYLRSKESKIEKSKKEAL